MANLSSSTPTDGTPPAGANAAQPSPPAAAVPGPVTPAVHKPGDPEVEATFVFVDAVKHGIKGLTVKIDGGGKSETVTTGEDGTAVTWTDAKRGEPIKIYVKKKSGDFDLKGTVTPKLDVNNYTIQSPEYHLEAITKLDAEEQLETDLHIPTVKDGEVMTVERLTGELAPFIASKQVVTETGKVLKDTPAKKKVVTEDPKTHKKKTKIEIEHHYKAVDTKKPHTVAMYVLGSRLNYPNPVDFSDTQYEWMRGELNKVLVTNKTIKAGDPGIELAAIKAIAQTEGSGSGFTANGLPKILFERHHFYKMTAPRDAKGNVDKKKPHPYAKHPDICNPNAGGYSDGFSASNFEDTEFGKKLAPQDKHDLYQYERFVKAALLDKDAAIKACSWGAFQVLAEPFTEMGYSSAAEIANGCMKSIDEHCKLFVQFLKMSDKKAIIPALYSKDWETVAGKYNGVDKTGKPKPAYVNSLKAKYDSFK
jgi:hypothetical protein